MLTDVTIVIPMVSRAKFQTLKISEGKIASIAEAAASPKSHADDFAGCFVLPGLIDMHVHHPPANALPDIRLMGLLYLSHGITAVRDCGSDGIALTKKRIEQGKFAGPRIFWCGPFIDGEPPIRPGSRVVRSAAEAESLVTELADTGAQFIKAYWNLAPEPLAALRTAAERRGLEIIGHVPLAVPFEDSRLADVQHLTGAVPVEGQCCSHSQPVRAVAAMMRGWRDVDQDRMEFVVRTSVQQRLRHTPTIVALEQMAKLQNYRAARQEQESKLLPRYYRDLIWAPGSGLPFSELPTSDWEEFAAGLGKVRELARRLSDAGVVLHVGSDTLSPFSVPGVSFQRELSNFIEIGFTPEQAWAAATSGNAASLPEAGLGSVRVGAPADLLIFREDPTRDFGGLCSLQAVIADGRLYEMKVLKEALQNHLSFANGWLYDRVMMLVVGHMVRRHAKSVYL